MKQKIKNTLTILSKNKLIKQIFKGRGIIFMLHRIAPFENKLKANENMKVSPEFLERFIKEAKDANYTFISIDELCEGLKNNNLINNFICITIDDGYRDNLEYGCEIFLKHNVPFCIYICTSLIESTHNMWWFGLEDYLLENTKFKFNDEIIDISSKKSKEEIFLKIRNIIIEKSAYGGDILDSLNIKFDAKKYAKLILSWEDIRFLDSINGGGRKICTIGSHTHLHGVFKNLNINEIKEDILKAQELLKSHLGYYPSHFAYPFGSINEVAKNHFKIPGELNFKTATTTRYGPIYKIHKNYMHSLPRIMLTENFMLESASCIRRKLIDLS